MPPANGPGWRCVIWALLAAGLVFCHGCHSDEDNELCVLPPPHTPQRFRRDAKSGAAKRQLLDQSRTTSSLMRSVAVVRFGFFFGVRRASPLWVFFWVFPLRRRVLGQTTPHRNPKKSPKRRCSPHSKEKPKADTRHRLIYPARKCSQHPPNPRRNCGKIQVALSPWRPGPYVDRTQFRSQSASAAQSPGPTVRLGSSDDPNIDQSSAPSIWISPETQTDTGERVGRYPVSGEIARRHGAILRGHDPDLRRDLAIKVLLDASHDPEQVRRFVEEAQIAGQLQHPGIVPVYEIGLYADNRPYFTMKLVEGRTLSICCAERQTRRTICPRFLGIFQQVCLTIAYAHDRGVIHRDLKPGNIMVGSFGEVLVMDWGLAKVLNIAGQSRSGPNPTRP